jgi:hypothetical protein
MNQKENDDWEDLRHADKICFIKQAGLSLHASVTVKKKATQIEIVQTKYKIAISNNVFPGVRGLTTLSYTVYSYSTSGHTDLYIYIHIYICFYTVDMHFYTIYLFHYK